MSTRRTLLVGLSDTKQKVYLTTSLSESSWIGEKTKEAKLLKIRYIGFEAAKQMMEIGSEAIRQMIEIGYIRDLLGEDDQNKASFTFEIEFLE